MISCPNNYEKLVLICYPNGAGGKFLANCLGLGPTAVLQDNKLAQKQLAGQFNYQDKLDFINLNLTQAEETKKWADLGLGDHQFFGFSNFLYATLDHRLLQFKFDPVVQSVMDRGWQMFMMAHSTTWIEFHLKFWSNCRVIFFANHRKFINQRYKKSNDSPITPLEIYWNAVREETWPALPPTDEYQFNQLDLDIQHKLQHTLKFEIARWFDQHELEDQIWEEFGNKLNGELGSRFKYWDVEQNFNNDQCLIDNISDCCTWLNLPISNSQDLKDYFTRWKNIVHP